MTNTAQILSTASPLLMCEGRCRQPTTHRFDRVQDQIVVSAVSQHRLIYRCEPCAHERVWGALEPAIVRLVS